MVKCDVDNSSQKGSQGNIDINSQHSIRASLKQSSSHDNSNGNGYLDIPDLGADPAEGPSDAAWMCFDDDVVTAVPLHSLEATIVSGERFPLHNTFFILFFTS